MCYGEMKKVSNTVPINVCTHKKLNKCVCGDKNFFSISCQTNDEFNWETSDGKEYKGTPPKIKGIIYLDNVLFITVCLSCSRLQNFMSIK